MAARETVQIRRVYDEPTPDDGHRVLVDRLWPRGLSKDAVAVDEWAKAVAPSQELRRWYGHEPARFPEFQRRYQQELTEPQRREIVGRLRERARTGQVTLLTATKDIAHSQAAVLAEELRRSS